MWDDRYSETGFAYGKQPNDFLKEVFNNIPKNGRVLCLAEGEGRNAVFLAEQGFDVTAVDMSQVGLEKAQQFAQEKGVTITTQVANLADYDFGHNKWDGIVSIWAHMPKQLRHKVHKNSVDALKKGGVFILEAYTVEQLQTDGIGGPSANKKEMFMSLKDLQQELAGLDEVIGVEKLRDITEGKMHVGMSAVVQILAIKK